MNDLKATSLLQKLYKDSAREGQVRLVSTHDVTNPPVHYCNRSLAYFGSKMFYNVFVIMQIIIHILYYNITNMHNNVHIYIYTYYTREKLKLRVSALRVSF